jgi:hypothetical protein
MRALYRVERAKPSPNPSQLARLAEIGRQYRRALDAGIKYAADTLGRRTALTTAEVAAAGLGDLVGSPS